MERIPVVVVGAGPAGLATSYELGQAGVEHVVLERGTVGQTWRGRWDSFCLVTPNWTVQLPGGTYDGDDPDGFMPKDEIVAHFERYARAFDAPVREGIDVTSAKPAPEGGLLLETSEGSIEAGQVVLATGAYQRPHRPPGSETLPAGIHAIDAEAYTNPDDLPPGGVLIVGSGQTGCQIAEELNDAGRDVVLACGRAPWVPRSIEGKDVVAWVVATPFMEQGPEKLPSPLARLAANFQATGRGGGHDLNYRTLAAAGVTLTGRLFGADDGSVHFARDLAESVAFGDARYADVVNLVTKSCVERGERPPEFPPAEPFAVDAPEEMDLRRFGAVIFTAGFRPDYRSWVQVPDAFDDLGFPIQTDGASSVVSGLYFVGTHFLRKRKSSTLFGMGEDAAVIAGAIAKRTS